MQPAWVTTNAPADMARFAKRQLSAQPSRSLASVTQFTLLAMKLPDDCQVCSLSKPQEEWFRGSNTLTFDRPLLNGGVAGSSRPWGTNRDLAGGFPPANLTHPAAR
jgi:hypothetical protein